MFIQDDYGLSNNLASLSSDERMFTAKIQFKVLGYITGDGVNRDRPSITRQQSIVKIVVSEQAIEGNELEDDTGDGPEDTGDGPPPGDPPPPRDPPEGGNQWDGYFGLDTETRRDAGEPYARVHTSGSFRRF